MANLETVEHCEKMLAPSQNKVLRLKKKFSLYTVCLPRVQTLKNRISLPKSFFVPIKVINCARYLRSRLMYV